MALRRRRPRGRILDRSRGRGSHAPRGADRRSGIVRPSCRLFLRLAVQRENDEYLDPVYSQYREFFVLVDAHYDGRPVSWCPYIYVDNHHALARGLVQGFPKKIGRVHQTRVFASPGKASPTLSPGACFGAGVSCDERTLAQARVTLEKPLEDPSPLLSRDTINLRHFPTLEVGKYEKPAVHELVRMDYGDQQLADVWIGSGEIELFQAPREELADLRPVRAGMGFRGSMSYNVTQVFPLT
ncbi:acetoacetate decarboxylase family protein [Streptomyces sp. NPDC046859]|uniref:acetoacetate decarboxylase family protein n=1 Tax=Streptomyces sp. NPDC046859 TaxID=3155734 RepID=UPI0033CBEB0F